MKRRDSLARLIVLAATLATPAGAQKLAKMHRVGIFSIGADPADPGAWPAFIEAMRKRGYEEGKNLMLVRAFGSGDFDRLDPLMRDLIEKRVEVIILSGIREVRSARQATTKVPIVMTQMPLDPVAEGLVQSLARPGGNITGFMFLVPGMYQKYVEILTEAVPSATRIASLTSPPNPPALVQAELEAAAKLRRVQLTIAQIKDPAEIEPTLTRLKNAGVAGLVVPLDGFMIRHRAVLARAIEKMRLPAIYAARSHVDAGGLMAYGTSTPELMRFSAEYVDRILKGANPADLPVQQPTRFELVVNLKAAKTIDLALPSTIMVRADEVLR